MESTRLQDSEQSVVEVMAADFQGFYHFESWDLLDASPGSLGSSKLYLVYYGLMIVGNSLIGCFDVVMRLPSFRGP